MERTNSIERAERQEESERVAELEAQLAAAITREQTLLTEFENMRRSLNARIADLGNALRVERAIARQIMKGGEPES